MIEDEVALRRPESVGRTLPGGRPRSRRRRQWCPPHLPSVLVVVIAVASVAVAVMEVVDVVVVLHTLVATSRPVLVIVVRFGHQVGNLCALVVVAIVSMVDVSVMDVVHVVVMGDRRVAAVGAVLVAVVDVDVMLSCAHVVFLRLRG